LTIDRGSIFIESERHECATLLLQNTSKAYRVEDTVLIVSKKPEHFCPDDFACERRAVYVFGPRMQNHPLSSHPGGGVKITTLKWGWGDSRVKSFSR